MARKPQILQMPYTARKIRPRGCIYCGAKIDCVAVARGEIPVDGHFLRCVRCQKWSVLAGDGLRTLSDDEAQRLLARLKATEAGGCRPEAVGGSQESTGQSMILGGSLSPLEIPLADIKASLGDASRVEVRIADEVVVDVGTEIADCRGQRSSISHLRSAMLSLLTTAVVVGWVMFVLRLAG